MAGHRYWRLRGIASFPGQDTNPMWVCDYAWLDASHTSLGTPTFSASSSAVEAGNFGVAHAGDAHDAIHPHGWQSNANFDEQWIAADYGSAVLPRYVQFRDPAEGTAAYWLGTQVAIEWSDDATTWTQSQIIEPGYIPGDAPYVFRVDDPGHRYWRLAGVTEVSGHSSDGFGLNSLGFFDASGASVGSSTLSASNTDGSWSLAQATSANGGGVGWYSGNGGTGLSFATAWIAADFGAIVQPKFVDFCALNSYPWTTGRVVAVQWSDDGSTWTTLTTLKGLGAARDGEVRRWRVGYEPEFPVPHRAWRVKSDAVGNTGRGCTVASEIEFLSDEFGSSLTYGKSPYALFCSSEGYGNRTNAFDLDKGTIWHASCGTGGNDYICWDSGASTGDWLAPTRFSWRARDDGTYAPQDTITLGGLEWTDDDPAGTPTWTRLYSIVQQNSWGAAERRVPAVYTAPSNDVDGHRYWRVQNFRNNTGQTGIAELEMARTPGGDNICRTYQGGSPFTDGNYNGYEAYRAFDGVLNSGSSEWGVTGGGNSQHVLGWDFGSGNAYTINEIRMAPMSDSGATPRWFEVQSSDDNSTWTREWIGFYTDTISYGTLRTFTRPDPDTTGAHRFMAMTNRMSAGEKYYGQSAGSYLDLVCREFEMAATAGGTNVCTGGTGFWYPTSDPASRLFDGDYNNEAYNGATGCLVATIGYDFGSGNTQAVSSIRYTRGDSYNGNLNRSPGEGWLIYSDDGYSWDILATYSGVDYQPPGVGTSDTGTINFTISSTASMVGTATGTSTALGVYIAAGTTEGHASGAGAALGRSMSLGVIGRAGQSTGQGVALGRADPFRPMAGTALGTSGVLGRGAAVGTIVTVGNADGTSTGDSGSAATGIISSDGASAGTSNALGVGTGRQEQVGTAAGTSTADAGGSYAPTLTVARSFGTSTVNAVATGVRRIAGSSIGTSEVLGRAAGVRSTVGSAAGQGSALAVTNKNDPGVGAADGTSSAAAAATALCPAVGSSDATSTASATTVAFSPARGSSIGSSTVIGAALALAARAGLSTGNSNAIATTSPFASGVGSATGSSTSVGASRELHLMRGSASGASAGDGIASASSPAVGRAVGTSTAVGVGAETGPGMELPEIVVVDLDDWLVHVAAPSDELVVVEVDDEIVLVPLDDSAALAA